VRVHESFERPRGLSRLGFGQARAAGLRLREFNPGQAAQWGAGGPVEAVELSPADSGGTPARLYRLSPAQLETRMWVAFDPGVGYLGETLRRTRWMTKKAGFRFHKSGELTIPSRSRMTFDFPAIAIGGPFGQNYWLFEVVGRYLAIRRFVPDDAGIVLKSNLAAYQPEALTVAGITAASVHELPPDQVALFPVLYVPATGGPSGISRVVIDALRTLSPATTKPHRRLYVSRQGASRSRILNEDQFTAIIEAHGFVTVVAEELSVQQQIELFAEAEAVLGVHGAGLTNAVFSPSGALLIELQPSSGLSPARIALYGDLASLAGLGYLRILCRPAAEDWKAVKVEDVYVDCDRLDADLREHLRPRTGG
jgi:Glycosyltransferase 61